jgi:hypothetical protein
LHLLINRAHSSTSLALDHQLSVRLSHGRGQPPPLSSGEIPCFDDRGEIRRCDWPENRVFSACPV